MSIDWSTPLAERMRPASLSEFVGQQHLLAKGKPLAAMLAGGHLHSMILWGAPGNGKTTLARMLSERADAAFITLSAVTSGVPDIRRAVDAAREHKEQGKQTLLFVDEVHRFNKAQQDAFLPHIESGVIVFVGATAENPAFELNNALLSRSRVYALQPLGDDDLQQLTARALADKTRGLGELQLQLDKDAAAIFIKAAHGDARRLLNMLEIAADIAGADKAKQISAEIAAQVATGRVQVFDKRGDVFYDQISALHKSIRGGDPDAALYWLHRMLQSGADPHYILRRLVRIASEDIGNADPRALGVALDAWRAYDRLGAAEGELAISQAAAYLAVAAKSNAMNVAHKAAAEVARQSESAAVPLHLRNAPTKLAKSQGHGKNYRYDHDEPDAHAAGQQYFPDEVPAQQFYTPTARGLEKKISEKIKWLRERNAKAAGKK